MEQVLKSQFVSKQSEKPQSTTCCSTLTFSLSLAFLQKKDILIVTKFVKGKSLQVLLDEETEIEDAKKTELIKDVLRGTAYLHEVGVVHGDVKRENILVTSSLGNAKICDFGLGRLRQHASLSVASLTLGENVIDGTPPYMAPECLMQKARSSSSSDVWSLGVTLLEFLTFKDPWEQVLEGQDVDTELKKLVAALNASLLSTSLFLSLLTDH